MTTVIKLPSNPSRRSFLNAGAAAALTGIAVVAIATPDAQAIEALPQNREATTETALTAIHAELIEVDLAQDQLCDLADTYPNGSVEREALWAEVYVYTGRYHELIGFCRKFSDCLSWSWDY